jgi:PIN domain nuclease of toxin-antitoxin system
MLSKHDRKRLALPEGRLVESIERTGAHLISLKPEHAEEGLGLHALHADPFDRMLVGTARFERMILLTRDADLVELAAPRLGPLLQEACRLVVT